MLVVAFVIATLTMTVGIERGALYMGRSAVADSIGSAGSGSAMAPAPAPDAATEVGAIQKLWRGGSFIAAGAVALYLGLTLAAKVDRTHAFYISAAVTALATVAESAVNGTTPTAGMMLAAGATFVGIITRGPSMTDGPSKS